MEQVPATNYKVVLVYFLVIALDSISFGLIGPILAPLLAHASGFFSSSFSPFFHYCIYGILISLFPLAFMLGAPILGMLSDQYGRKRVILFCLSLTLISFVSYALAFALKSISLFITARLLAGLSAGSQGVAQAAVVDFAKQNERPQVISFIAVGMTMGLVVGPLVASLWKHTATWVPFVIMLLLGSLSVCVLLLLVRDDYPVFAERRAKPSIKILLKKPKTLRTFTLFFLFELGWSLYYQSVPLWLSSHWNLKNPQLGFINSFIGIMLALSLLLGTRIGLRFTSLTSLIRLGFGIGILALIYVSTTMSLPCFFLFSFLIVLAVALIYPGLITQLSSSCSPEQQGLLMGVTDGLLSLAFTITAIISSLLIYVNSTLPFFVAAICWLVAGLGSIQYKKVIACSSVST